MHRCWICKRPAVSELQVELPVPAAELAGLEGIRVGEVVLVGINACREHRPDVVRALLALALEHHGISA